MKKFNINKNNLETQLKEIIELIDFSQSKIIESENKYPFSVLIEKELTETLFRNIIHVHLVSNNFVNIYDTNNYIEFKLQREKSYYQIILHKKEVIK